MTGDFNRDGNLDLVFSSTATPQVFVVLGNGNFDPELGFTTLGPATSLVTGDGNLDLAMSVTSRNSIVVLTGAGNGTFGLPTELQAGPSPFDLVSVFTFRLARARNQALAAAAQTKRAQSFMGYLLSDGGDPAGPSSTLKAVTLLDRGEQLARTLNNEPELQSEFVHSLGSSYFRLEQHTKGR